MNTLEAFRGELRANGWAQHQGPATLEEWHRGCEVVYLLITGKSFSLLQLIGCWDEDDPVKEHMYDIFVQHISYGK